MNSIGIVAGIGPESTIEYYRLIIKRYRERLNSTHYPQLVLHSIDMTAMLDLVFQDKLDELVAFLQERIQVLEDAGVDYVALASNTPHLVFDQVAAGVGPKMISIVEAACQKVADEGLSKVALLGTKSTMTKGFYQAVGQRNGIEIIVPNEADQDFVHEKYMGELVFNQIVPETKRRLLEIVMDLQQAQQIEGLILGGTELPLILQPSDFDGLKVFDTTLIHVEAILDKMIMDSDEHNK